MSSPTKDTSKIIGVCHRCGHDYTEIPGAMECRNCGLIESFRMIAVRNLMGVDTALKIVTTDNTRKKESK